MFNNSTPAFDKLRDKQFNEDLSSFWFEAHIMNPTLKVELLQDFQGVYQPEEPVIDREFGRSGKVGELPPLLASVGKTRACLCLSDTKRLLCDVTHVAGGPANVRMQISLRKLIVGESRDLTQITSS